MPRTKLPPKTCNCPNTKSPCKHRNLLALYPELCEEWNYELNELEPICYSGASNVKVWWVCKKHSACDCHVWFAKITDRSQKKNGCPFCCHQRVCAHDNLSTNYPEIAAQWNYESNELGPENYASSSGKIVSWKCNTINVCECHTWMSSIYERTRGGRCPYCNKNKACKHNNITISHPFICEIWNYELNKINPSEYTYGSELYVWWICKNHTKCKCHIWQTQINSVCIKKTGCPFCSHKQVCQHDNLLTNFPNLCLEWDHDVNELGPEKYSCYSSQKVAWKCKKLHKWITTINSRTSGEFGCGRCKVSKGEKYISDSLNINKLIYETQKSFKKCVNINVLKFDFYIESLNLLIEYDGEQHFRYIEFFKSSPKNDIIKNIFTKNKYNLLRISYEEINYIDDIICHIIQLISNTTKIQFYYNIINKIKSNHIKTIYELFDTSNKTNLNGNIQLIEQIKVQQNNKDD